MTTVESSNIPFIAARGTAQRIQELEAQLASVRMQQHQQQHQQVVEEQLVQWAARLRWTTGASLKSWAEHILTELVAAAGQQQGALYLLEFLSAHPDGELVRLASVAASADAPTRIAVGEGLTGQVARSQKPMMVDAPGAFVRPVRNGVAVVDLNVLVLEPLLSNGRLEGVVELVGVVAPNPTQRLLLDRLMEPLAAALAAARSQTQIQHLYAEAQGQREQLQAAEEEMRQNLEELQATQDQLRQAQEEQHQQLTAIDRSTLVMELAMDGTLLRVNANLARLLGYTSEELVGKPHRTLLPPDGSVLEADYDAMWAQLRTGAFCSGQFPRQTAYGHLVWLKGSYNPVLNAQGKPYRVLKIAHDLTEARAAQAQTEAARQAAEAALQEAQFAMEELTQTEQRYRQQIMQLMDRVQMLEGQQAV